MQEKIEKELKNFGRFRCEIVNLCSQIGVVESSHMLDLKTEESKYLNSVKERYAGVIYAFFVALRRANNEGVEFFLSDKFEIIVNFTCKDGVMKELRHTSFNQVKANIPAYINFLTRKWDPLKG